MIYYYLKFYFSKENLSNFVFLINCYQEGIRHSSVNMVMTMLVWNTLLSSVVQIDSDHSGVQYSSDGSDVHYGRDHSGV